MSHDVSIREGIKELGIFEKNSDAWVTSRDIARLFGKDHKHVMESIRDKIIPNITEEFSRSNFRPSKFKDNRGKTQPEYMLNRKSFPMVVMGFTGSKAMRFKEAYIEAFDEMVTVIVTRILSKAGYKEMTGAIKQTFKSQRAYATEADMVNQIVLGMKAAEFKELNDTNNTRDAVVQSKLEQLDKAQRLNAQLIIGGLTFEHRKEILRTNFK